MKTLTCITDAMHVLGYGAGRPPWARAGAEIDAAAYREMICPDCGATGMAFRPFYRPPQSFKAFAVCACGLAEEI
jgi:hypothetical protein